MDTTWLEIVSIVLRWIHLLGGIFWFGLGFFMNFVHLAYMPTLDPVPRRAVILGLVPRVLILMMGGAVVSVSSGLLLGWLAPRNPPADSDWLNLGIILGFVIFTVGVLVIIPSVLKIVRLTKEGQPPPLPLVKRLTFFSKLNAYLGIPLIFAMLAGSGHFLHRLWPLAVLICLVGWACVWLLFRVSVRVSTEV